MRIQAFCVCLALGISLASPVVSAQDRYRMVRKIEKPDAQPGDRFGESIAVVGDIIAVGARDDDTGAVNAGAVYLFNGQGDFLRAIPSPNPQRDAWFGEIVRSVGDDMLIISARRENNGSGRAYLYRVSGDLLGTFESPTPSPGDEFGARGVASNGSHVLLSEWRETSLEGDKGAAYLFGLDGLLMQTFVNPERGQLFGRDAMFVGSDKLLIWPGK